MEKYTQNSTEGLIIRVIKTSLFLMFIFIVCNCEKKKVDFSLEFKQNLTNDSIGYWDYFPYEFEYGVKKGSIDTYGFNKKGTLELYRMRYNFEISGDVGNMSIKYTDTIGKRMFVRLDTVPRPSSFQTNKWGIRNDSIFNIMDVYGYKIIRYSKDSIVMKLVSYHGRPYEDSIKRFHILHRVKESDLRLDERSKILKDSLDRLNR